jgi:predicted ATPase
MSPRFDSIHIQGFRRLVDARLALQPLNVLIGANGCGKSSLLDVFTLLARSAPGKLQETLRQAGGIDSCLTNLTAVPKDGTRSMAFELTMTTPEDQQFDYRLQIELQGLACRISEEALTQRSSARGAPIPHLQRAHDDIRYFQVEGEQGVLVRPTWNSDRTESALSQVPKMFQQPESFRKRLASALHYYSLDVGARSPVRLPQPMREARLPGQHGEDLVSCLYTLRETEPERFERIEATLRAAFPEFERLGFPPVAAGTLALTWKNRTSTNPLSMHQLSEGTVRFLWLVTLLQCPGLTAATLIDLPEVSLHPELLSLIADLLREASERTQLILATQADRLVRFLKPSEIVTVDVSEDGAATFTRADELDLEPWLEDHTLDEVWRLGRMGGRA